MNRRVFAAASLVTVIALLVAVQISRQADVDSSDLARDAPAVPATRSSMGRGAQPVLTEVANDVTSITKANTIARVGGGEYAERYALEMCACIDRPCAEEVRDRFAANLGAADPEQDTRRLHAAFDRAAGCQRATERALTHSPNEAAETTATCPGNCSL